MGNQPPISVVAFRFRNVSRHSESHVRRVTEGTNKGGVRVCDDRTQPQGLIDASAAVAESGNGTDPRLAVYRICAASCGVGQIESTKPPNGERKEGDRDDVSPSLSDGGPSSADSVPPVTT